MQTNKDLKEQVIEYLTNNCITKSKAISMDLLADIHHISTRAVRSIIEDIRTNDIPLTNGYCLVSHNEGYWLSKDEQDIENWINRYLGTAKTQFKVAKATIKQLNREKQAKIQGEFQF
jgi:hypothetical protein